MNTLTLAVWGMCGIVILYIAYLDIYSTDAEDEGALSVLVLPLIFVSTVVVAPAIDADIEGQSFELFGGGGKGYALLAGLTTLGLLAVYSLFVRVFRGGGSLSIAEFKLGGVAGFIVQIISLIASILGIIQFYLEYGHR